MGTCFGCVAAALVTGAGTVLCGCTCSGTGVATGDACCVSCCARPAGADAFTCFGCSVDAGAKGGVVTTCCCNAGSCVSRWLGSAVAVCGCCCVGLTMSMSPSCSVGAVRRVSFSGDCLACSAKRCC